MNLATKVRLAAWALAGILLALPAVSAKPAKETFALGNLFATHCIQCHGKEGKVKGKVDLLKYSEGADLSEDSELLQAVLDVIDFGEMPPEDEEQIPLEVRDSALEHLQGLLKAALAEDAEFPVTRIRRMNRFQYATLWRKGKRCSLIATIFVVPNILLSTVSTNLAIGGIHRYSMPTMNMYSVSV